MKKLSLLLFPALLLGGCKQNSKPDIVTTSFVSYDIVRNIVGTELVVRNIVPWGSELHNFEPKTQDIVNINEAELFVYTTPLLETWVKDLVENENAFDMSAHYEIEHHHEEEDEHDHNHNHSSLHFWTNPVWYVEIMDELLTTLTALYPENASLFTQNHLNYTNKIKASITELNSFLAPLSNPTIYFAGHNAMDAFSDEFGLIIKSLSHSYKPDIDFTATDIIAVIEEMIENDVHYLFVEELAEPRAAEVMKAEFLKRNHTIEIRELHGYHNITSDDAKENVTYEQLFKRNVNFIKEALST